MLRIANGSVMHPRQLVGLLGLELKPDSADGSFSLSVRVDGARLILFRLASCQLAASILLVRRTSSPVRLASCSARSRAPSAACCGQKAEFTLPSLKGTHPRSATDKKKATLPNGARWGMTYRRGSLELFMAMPDDELQSLVHVQWPWGEALPLRAYSAAVLFKPRRGGSGSVGCPATNQHGRE